MGVDDGFGEGQQFQATEGVLGKEFLDARGPLSEGIPDDATEGPGVEGTGEAVDGQQAGGVDEGEAVLDHVVFWRLHDGSAAEGLDFAAEGDSAARLELAGQEGIAEPDDGEVAGFVGDYGPGGGLTPFSRAWLGRTP